MTRTQLTSILEPLLSKLEGEGLTPDEAEEFLRVAKTYAQASRKLLAMFDKLK